MRDLVLVTGTSSGIGRAIALRLLGKGYDVLGISRRPAPPELDSNPKFCSRAIDLSKVTELKESLSQLSKEYPDVNSIIFCAGYGRFGNLEEFSYDQIIHTVNTNLTAQIMLARAFLPQMKKCGNGRLIFISSEATLSGGRRGAVYTASKAGITGLASALRKECSPSSVYVGVVIPGMVKTEFYDYSEFTHGDSIENYLEPFEVANAVLAMLESSQGTVIDKIVLTPLKTVIKRRGK